MHFNRKFCRCSALALVGLVSSTAHGTTWNGASPTNGNFSTGANWVGGVAPGTTDDAEFTLFTATRTDVSLDTTRSIKNLTVTTTTATGSFQILQAAGGPLTYTNVFTVGLNTPVRLTSNATLI